MSKNTTVRMNWILSDMMTRITKNTRHGKSVVGAFGLSLCLFLGALGVWATDMRGASEGKAWGYQGMPPIERLSDAFRYSPSSQFAPGDGGVCLDWVDDDNLQIVKVTNLDNDGEGSLRWALEQITGIRLVVFEVGGVIDLERKRLRLIPPHGNVIIAGQTAPAPGITIIREAFDIHAPNVIVQHIRVRSGTDIDRDAPHTPGHRPPSVGDGSRPLLDALSIASVYDGGGNIIVDHCSVSWGTDEVLSVSEISGNVQGPDGQYKHDAGPGKRPPITVSNTIIADGLVTPGYTRAQGSLLYRGFAHYFAGNLFANVNTRTPWIGAYGGCDAVVVNTLGHNLGWSVLEGIEANGSMRVALIGNTFSDRRRGFNFDITRRDNIPKELYLHDNDYTSTPGMQYWRVLDESPVSLHNIKPLPATDVLAHHLRTVGARPAERTPLDERVILQVKEGKSQFINSQEDVGGYPQLESTRRPCDVPTEPAARGHWLYRHTMAVEVKPENQ